MSLYEEHVLENITPNTFHVCINYREYRGCMVSEHWHDYYELLYIYDGQAEQTINNTHFTLNKGDVLLIAPEDIHSTISTLDNCYIGVILFMHNKDMKTLHLSTPFQNEQDIVKLFCKINEEYTFKLNGYDSIIQGCISELIGYLQRNADIYEKRYEKQPSEVVDICQYIKKNIEKPLTLKQVADFAGYMPTYFSRYFKKNTGTSFKQYVDNLKILAAKRLILLEGLSVTQASERLSYENVSSFCRAFKRVTGYPPTSLISKTRLPR